MNGRRILVAAACAFALAIGGCRGPVRAQREAAEPLREQVAITIDRFHKAAKHADEETYFGLMAPEMIFLGTDATEHWTLEEFREFARPHFAAGRGWTFVPRDRTIVLAPDRRTAWFDELLDSEHYGECRGSGVLRLIDGQWRMCQYHLTVPVPNDLLADVVRRIRAHQTRPVEP
jgi:hypothetical protein